MCRIVTIQRMLLWLAGAAVALLVGAIADGLVNGQNAASLHNLIIQLQQEHVATRAAHTGMLA
jgi:hypothetical protein